MVSQKVNILDENGLHMRPAKDFSQIAVGYKSKIQIKYRNGEYNAKSLISMLGAGIKTGSQIEIICEGEDEMDALSTLVSYLEK